MSGREELLLNNRIPERDLPWDGSVTAVSREDVGTGCYREVTSIWFQQRDGTAELSAPSKLRTRRTEVPSPGEAVITVLPPNAWA